MVLEDVVRLAPKRKVKKTKKVEKVYDFDDEFNWCADPTVENPPINVEVEFDETGEIVIKSIERDGKYIEVIK